jgi:hypothetical protein
MQNQLALVQVDSRATEVSAVWDQLPQAQKEVALRLLAELMAGSVACGGRASKGRGSEEDDHA